MAGAQRVHALTCIALLQQVSLQRFPWRGRPPCDTAHNPCTASTLKLEESPCPDGDCGMCPILGRMCGIRGAELCLPRRVLRGTARTHLTREGRNYQIKCSQRTLERGGEAVSTLDATVESGPGGESLHNGALRGVCVILVITLIVGLMITHSSPSKHSR